MSNRSEIKKLEQGRAEFAYRCVEEIIELRSIHNLGFVNKIVEKYKNKILKDFDKKIKEGKITKERINEILNSPHIVKEDTLNEVEKEVYKKYKKNKENYKSYTKKLPTMILSNGLGQTLAFVKAKAKDGNAYEFIYAQLTEYLKSNTTTRRQMPADETELLKWVISRDTKEYRYITQELLAFLNWLRRFAEGMIEEEE